jgi:hypothetical protein
MQTRRHPSNLWSRDVERRAQHSGGSVKLLISLIWLGDLDPQMGKHPSGPRPRELPKIRRLAKPWATKWGKRWSKSRSVS